jgi:hypothetical protein
MGAASCALFVSLKMKIILHVSKQWMFSIVGISKLVAFFHYTGYLIQEQTSFHKLLQQASCIAAQ